MNKPRVLLTYIESGMGHIMSMSAISGSLKEKYGQDVDIIESYVMEQGEEITARFEKFLSGCTKETNKHKSFGMGVFILLDVMGKQHFMRFIHKTVFKKATDETIEVMRSYEPDVIISTHYFITFAAIELKKRYMPNLTVITYNPDNNVHVWWDNRSDIFINNNLNASEEAVKKRHFEQDSVKNVFFTAREEIVNCKHSKKELREKYHLPLNNFTVIIADGAYASAKAKKVCNNLLKLSFPVTIIILAGKNKKVFTYFTDKKRKVKRNITLIPLEFTPLAYEYYGASDVFITKAGPNATLDSLFMGTPVIFDYYAHPIEKATAHLFARKLNCAVEEYKIRNIPNLLEKMYLDPRIIKGLKQNIIKNVNKNNNGAEQISDIIMSEIKKKKNNEESIYL